MINISALSVPAARGGAAFSGCGSWAPVMSGAGLSGAGLSGVGLSGAGLGHAQALIPVSAIVPVPRLVNFAGAPGTPATKRPLAVKAELPTVDNSIQYVRTTRVSAGGEGASGPHPPREPGL